MIAHLRNSADVEFIAELDNIDDLLSPDSAINLYRTVQECVNNVIKHSNAAKAWVFVKRTENNAEITCRDNGRGLWRVRHATARASPVWRSACG